MVLGNIFSPEIDYVFIPSVSIQTGWNGGLVG